MITWFAGFRRCVLNPSLGILAAPLFREDIQARGGPNVNK